MTIDHRGLACTLRYSSGDDFILCNFIHTFLVSELAFAVTRLVLTTRFLFPFTASSRKRIYEQSSGACACQQGVVASGQWLILRNVCYLMANYYVCPNSMWRVHLKIKYWGKTVIECDGSTSLQANTQLYYYNLHLHITHGAEQHFSDFLWQCFKHKQIFKRQDLQNKSIGYYIINTLI